MGRNAAVVLGTNLRKELLPIMDNWVIRLARNKALLCMDGLWWSPLESNGDGRSVVVPESILTGADMNS